MSAQGADAGGLHACRTSTHDDDLGGTTCRREAVDSPHTFPVAGRIDRTARSAVRTGVEAPVAGDAGAATVLIALESVLH